jgi:hypothetical protein
MTSVCKIREENGGIFTSHLYGLKEPIGLGRIIGFDFRLAMEVKFVGFSFDNSCLVSTICIRENSNVSTSFHSVQYWMCEMHRISAVLTSICSFDFGLQN